MVVPRTSNKKGAKKNLAWLEPHVMLILKIRHIANHNTIATLPTGGVLAPSEAIFIVKERTVEARHCMNLVQDGNLVDLP